MLAKTSFNQYIGNFKSKSMEKLTAIRVVNISANAESKRGSIIVADLSAEVTSEFGTRATKEVLVTITPDVDIEDPVTTYAVIPSPVELDRLIAGLKAIRREVWGTTEAVI